MCKSYVYCVNKIMSDRDRDSQIPTLRASAIEIDKNSFNVCLYLFKNILDTMHSSIFCIFSCGYDKIPSSFLSIVHFIFFTLSPLNGQRCTVTRK